MESRGTGTRVLAIISIISVYFFSGCRDKRPPDTVRSEKDTTAGYITYEIPNDLEFAGEIIPLNDYDLRERYDREILSNAYFHSNTILLFKRSGRWFPLMKPILEKNQLPLDFLYLPLIESGLTNMVSPKSAVGFWQLTAGSARELGLIVNNEIDERYNPLKSTEAACRYLIKAKQKFGNWINAAAAYNMGMRGLSRLMEMQKMDSYEDLLLNEETSRYIFRILAMKEIFTNPGEYGFLMSEQHYYSPEPVKEVVIGNSIPDLAEYALSLGINYKLLKRYNPWLRKNFLTINDPSKPVVIQVPAEHPQFVRQELHLIDSLNIGEDRYEPEEE
ncbi:MAG TPA: transglycosylase SLT domain-containing protein [Cyclobacteriaceae bacterium]|nr:transglycosylase SLT domain-containing protein [Cyclobacteriaceae bacterium]